ncbi:MULTISPECIES: C40 family peptidase [Priestia]|uniref:C40 family peptidase n=1 Tax=Priestia TaxID=2800373 RepID=UPI000762BCA8|nr:MULTISPECIES: peptidoglycan-binding protein [Priestia]KWU60999.1 peptidase [Priestia megaterium]MCE4092772.1 peptidoglycan-binding protein [Priestia megaterium]MED3821949.1 peptidoglycan-binding protein [Priestia aryabhattai]
MKKLVATMTVASALFASPIISNAAFGDQTLKSGMKNNDVKQLQQVLKQKGYFKNSTTTTYFGSITKQSVVNFQKANRLSADGIVGPATFKALNVASSNQGSNTATAGTKVLKQGMTSSDVQKLQQILKQKGYFKNSTTTTYFGSITKQAVVNFQKANKLVADGIVGPATWRALGSSGSATAPSPSKPVPPSNASTSSASKLINTGKKYIGVKYVWGGTTPSGFDCSGFLDYVYKEALGIKLPRTVADIYKVGVSVKSPSVGDLVFFETYKPGPSHAGIYLGNGQFLQAGSSTGVTISSMSNSYWSQRYLGAKKINY